MTRGTQTIAPPRRTTAPTTRPCAAGCRLPEAIKLAWQSGYAYALGRAYDAADHLARVAEAIDDARHAPELPPLRSREQRIADRLAEAAACAERLHARAGTREWLGLERGDRVMPW